MTGSDRQAKVQAAAVALPAALQRAAADPGNVTLWADVEALGATIHRQARLLAGKPRGG